LREEEKGQKKEKVPEVALFRHQDKEKDSGRDDDPRQLHPGAKGASGGAPRGFEVAPEKESEENPRNDRKNVFVDLPEIELRVMPKMLPGGRGSMLEPFQVDDPGDCAS
jgi:hypothetical protein